MHDDLLGLRILLRPQVQTAALPAKMQAMTIDEAREISPHPCDAGEN